MIHCATRIALMPTYASLIDKLAATEMDVSQTGVQQMLPRYLVLQFAIIPLLVFER